MCLGNSGSIEVLPGETPSAVQRTCGASPDQRQSYFFSMFHIGGTDGTESTPLILSER